jgi:hypothetical protein
MEPEEIPTFNPNVPLRKDKFNSSQLDFLTNFMTLYTAFSANHVALDATSNAGNHNVIQLLEQPTGSTFQTDLGEISIYCKAPSNTEGVSLDQGDQIFLKYQGNQPEFQLSAYQIFAPPIITGGGITQTPFFTFLPGKVLLYFGTIKCSLQGLGSTNAPLYLRPPIATNIITMNFCLQGNNAGYPPMVSIKTANGNGFYEVLYLQSTDLQPTPANQTFFYVVLANI